MSMYLKEIYNYDTLMYDEIKLGIEDEIDNLESNIDKEITIIKEDGEQIDFDWNIVRLPYGWFFNELIYHGEDIKIALQGEYRTSKIECDFQIFVCYNYVDINFDNSIVKRTYQFSHIEKPTLDNINIDGIDEEDFEIEE